MVQFSKGGVVNLFVSPNSRAGKLVVVGVRYEQVATTNCARPCGLKDEIYIYFEGSASTAVVVAAQPDELFQK